MTAGGFKISEMQFRALCRMEKSPVAENAINSRTSWSLSGLGLAEVFRPHKGDELAARKPVRYFRLTKAGKEAIEGLKIRYKREV